MPDTRDEDEFEGIEMSGPWGDVRIGSGGAQAGRHGAWDGDDDEYRRVRRRVRDRLSFYRHLTTFLIVVGALALLDWATGDDWWVQWVAGIWGAFVLLQFLSTFVSPALWGREAEERMIEREMQRRRGRVHVTPPE